MQDFLEWIQITPMREFTAKYIPLETQANFNKTKWVLIITAGILGGLIELLVIYYLRYFGAI
jgi:hypothetical protein